MYNGQLNSMLLKQVYAKNCAYLIKKIRCNESLELKTHLCGRKPRIDVDNIRILEKTLDDDPYIILKQLQKN